MKILAIALIVIAGCFLLGVLAVMFFGGKIIISYDEREEKRDE